MMFLVVVGMLMVFVGAIGILINAFRESVLWGLGSLLLSPVMLVYVIMHWDDNKKPFLLQLAGVGLLIVAAVMAPDPAAVQAVPPL